MRTVPLSRSMMTCIACLRCSVLNGASRDHLRKDELIVKLLAYYKRAARAKAHVNGKHPSVKTNGKFAARTRPQIAAARNTNGTTSTEEQIERSKFDVGIPTKDLSAKVPKELPGGYGKDRIIVMVRDPYWLHAYWEMTRQAVQRAEAALGQDWHGAKPILRVLDVTCHDTTNSPPRAASGGWSPSCHHPLSGQFAAGAQ